MALHALQLAMRFQKRAKAIGLKPPNLDSLVSIIKTKQLEFTPEEKELFAYELAIALVETVLQ